MVCLTDFSPRTMLLKDNVLSVLPLKEYAHAAYAKTISEVPVLEGENKEETRRRQISYLNLKWFMQTLLDRGVHSLKQILIQICVGTF